MRSRIILAVCFAWLGACASDTSVQGFTPCGDFPSGPVDSQPGQYCADATFSECVPGCTSAVNCAEGQRCVKPAGESVGDCVDEGPPPMGVVCGDGACEAGEDGASCPADCRTDPPPARCGDGVCSGAESQSSCPADCGPPADTTLDACHELCNEYSFFDCFAPGGLRVCIDACDASTPDRRGDFNRCAEVGTVSCDEACFELL